MDIKGVLDLHEVVQTIHMYADVHGTGSLYYEHLYMYWLEAVDKPHLQVQTTHFQ